MNSSRVPTLRLTSPDDIAQVVPFFVGFTPEKSLVILILENNQLAVSARVDLADIQPPGEIEDLLDRIRARFPDTNAILVAYSDDPQQGWDIIDRAVRHLPPDTVLDTIFIDQDSWHLPDGSSGRIRSASMIGQQAMHHGLQPVSRRSDLEAQFASAADSDELSRLMRIVETQLPSFNDSTHVLNDLHGLMSANLPVSSRLGVSDHGMSTVDAIKLARLVQHPDGFEFALLQLTKTDAAQHLALWRTVVNRTPARLASVPSSLAGVAAWIDGEGAIANVALTRADATGRPDRRDPAPLLRSLLDQVVHPATWPRIRAMFLAEATPEVLRHLSPRPQPESTVAYLRRSRTEQGKSHPSRDDTPRL